MSNARTAQELADELERRTKTTVVSDPGRCGNLAEVLLSAAAELRRLAALASQAEPTMSDAIAAGDGALHGAIDYWQQRALKAEQSEYQPVDRVQAHAAHCNGCSTCDKWRETLGAPMPAEQSEDREHAALYRWLRDHGRHNDFVVEQRRDGWATVHSASSLDDAIRAAIAAKEQS